MTKIKPTIQEVKPTAKPQHRVVAKQTNNMATVRYKPTGRIMRMTRKQAEQTVRQSPKNYEII